MYNKETKILTRQASTGRLGRTGPAPFGRGYFTIYICGPSAGRLAVVLDLPVLLLGGSGWVRRLYLNFVLNPAF